MSASAAAVFHDPEEYLEYLNSPGIWGAETRLATKGGFHAELMTRNVGGIACIRGRLSTTIFRMGASGADKVSLGWTDAPTIRNGVEIGPGELFLHTGSGGFEYQLRAEFPYAFRTIAIPNAAFRLLCDDKLPASARIRPSPEALAHFLRIHRAAMAKEASPGDLVHVAIKCLGSAGFVAADPSTFASGAQLDWLAPRLAYVGPPASPRLEVLDEPPEECP